MKFIFFIMAVAAPLAAWACPFPEIFRPIDVDILAGQTIATLIVSGRATVCTCDERNLSLVLSQIIQRRAFTIQKSYFVEGIGFCVDLNAG